MSHTSIDYRLALTFARVVGFAAASTAISLWCWLLIDGTINGGITGGTYGVGGVMIVLALLAAWGSHRLKSWALIIAFVGSFMPVGLYSLGANNYFVLVGYADVLYLFAGVLMPLEQYRLRRT